MSFSEASEAAAAAAPEAAATPPTQPDSPLQIAHVLLSLLRELPKLVSDRVELLSLDLQRAGLALGQIIGLIVAVAILGVTAWLLIWAGVLLALVMVGLPRWGALLVAVAINGLALWWAVAQIRSRVPKLLLATFRRHLSLAPLPDAPAAPDVTAASAAAEARRAQGLTDLPDPPPPPSPEGPTP